MGAGARLRGHWLTPADAFPRPTLMNQRFDRRIARSSAVWRQPLLGVAFLLVAVSLSAAPGFWQAATQADFLRGEVEQLSIDEHGRLTLGPELTRVHDAAAPFVWTIAPGPEGAWFLGTGNDGKVIKVDRNGQGSVFYDSSEMEVHALAPAPSGGLYVGTSPDGRIYKVDAKGQGTVFFDPD